MITPARRRAVFCAVALILPSAASWSPVYGDSWGPPQKEHWSANKRFVLQVEYPEPKSLSLCETTDDGLNGPPCVPEALSPSEGVTPSAPGLKTVRLTLRLVLPLPVVVFTKFTVSL